MPFGNMTLRLIFRQIILPFRNLNSAAIIPISKMWKVRHKQVKRISQNHKLIRGGSQTQTPVLV